MKGLGLCCFKVLLSIRVLYVGFFLFFFLCFSFSLWSFLFTLAIYNALVSSGPSNQSISHSK